MILQDENEEQKQLTDVQNISLNQDNIINKLNPQPDILMTRKQVNDFIKLIARALSARRRDFMYKIYMTRLNGSNATYYRRSDVLNMLELSYKSAHDIFFSDGEI